MRDSKHHTVSASTTRIHEGLVKIKVLKDKKPDHLIFQRNYYLFNMLIYQNKNDFPDFLSEII